MSTHFGGRTLARSQALQLLFQAEANSRTVEEVLAGDYALSEGPLDDYARELALGTDAARHDLDAIISWRSAAWSLDRMNAVDRNLLRLALYEILDVDDVEVAVTIDECVELAKAYGTDESSRFVNGVLGRVADALDEGRDVIAEAHAAVDAQRGSDAADAEPGDDAVEDDATDDAVESDELLDEAALECDDCVEELCDEAAEEAERDGAAE